MARTGPCLEKLSRKTALAVVNRMSKMLETDFVDDIFTDFMKDGFELDLMDNLNVGD